MKKLLLAVTVMMATLFSANAQEWSDLLYNRTNITYQNIHYSAKDNLSGMFLGDDGMSLNGFGIEYLMGIPLSTTWAMDIEWGVQFQAGWGGKKATNFLSKQKYNTNLFRINIPLQYIYHFNCGSGFRVAPFLGLDFRFNIVAKETLKTFNNGVQTGEWKTNFFNSMDMNDNKFKRFQMGWHVGLALEYYHFTISATYGTDFMPIYSVKPGDGKLNTSNLGVGIGWYY